MGKSAGGVRVATAEGVKEEVAELTAAFPENDQSRRAEVEALRLRIAELLLADRWGARRVPVARSRSASGPSHAPKGPAAATVSLTAVFECDPPLRKVEVAWYVEGRVKVSFPKGTPAVIRQAYLEGNDNDLILEVAPREGA